MAFPELDQGINLSPYLPDALAPIWGFLQEYPIFLVFLLVAIGYGVGKWNNTRGRIANNDR
jgi:hypothetical protein